MADSRVEGAATEARPQVNRWRRYGKDRLYVSLADDSKIGFWDLVSDEAHPESPELLPALAAAVAQWKATQTDSEPCSEGDRTVSQAAIASTDVDPAPLARPWIDLSVNKPGAEVREKAMAARDAAPVKTVLARVLGVHTDERAWRIGADGEELVGAQLAKMAKKDSRWRFVHSIPVGSRGSDIDHLVVGPGGVFTVNSKHHPQAKIWVGGNTFMVDGHRQPYVRNSRHEAQRAARLLSAASGLAVHVEGLIVTVNAADVVINSQPEGVSVTWRKNLARWLLSHGDILDTESCQAIFDAARRSTTWQS